MPFDYHRLSPTDFESLAADLAGAVHGVRFERFCEGRDGGIDFRQMGDDGCVTIGQAKRYKTAAQLVAKIGDELPKLQRLQPSRYLLMTSCALTPANKAAHDDGDPCNQQTIDRGLRITAECHQRGGCSEHPAAAIEFLIGTPANAGDRPECKA